MGTISYRIIIILWKGNRLYHYPSIDTDGNVLSYSNEREKKVVQRLLDYVATYNTTVVCFYKSDMVLEVDSDATYLVLLKACSRYAGFSRLLDKENTPNCYSYNGPRSAY